MVQKKKRSTSPKKSATASKARTKKRKAVAPKKATKKKKAVAKTSAPKKKKAVKKAVAKKATGEKAAKKQETLRVPAPEQKPASTNLQKQSQESKSVKLHSIKRFFGFRNQTLHQKRSRASIVVEELFRATCMALVVAFAVVTYQTSITSGQGARLAFLQQTQEVKQRSTMK